MFPRPISPASLRVPIIMPQLGESIAEATVVRIAVKPGDQVTADQEIIEVETQKALLQVSTPCAGQVVELLVEPQETYEVGATLGFIAATPGEAERLGLSSPTGDDADSSRTAAMPEVEPGQPAPNGQHSEEASPRTASPMLADIVPSVRLLPAETEATATRGLPVPARMGGAGYLSPRLKARLSELGLNAADLAGVSGTGAGGRVTTDDMEKFLTAVEARNPRPASAMRLAVADSMRRSWTRPLVTVGRTVRLDALFAHRASLSADSKPGITLYAMRALALALISERGAVSRLIGRKLVPAASIDVGFAVETDDGLVVPVLRGVDTTPLADLGGPFQELVAAARRRQLPVGASGDAAATVTNFGPFGLVWATPLPLPEESLMLGLGAGRKAPFWDEATGAFIPVTEADITLSFDHRVLDGGGSGRLLQKVVSFLEAPDQL